MVITRMKVVESTDVEKYAWAGLARYMNAEFVKREICRVHVLPKAQENNARSQADELRHCLSQAAEYAKAARSVSLATRPVLLYYACMSLALVEILFKQSADSRLSKLRQHHNCHGLQMAVAQLPDIGASIEVSANMLSAKPQWDSNGGARGTFEVWRRSAHEYPVGGMHTENIRNEGQTRGFEVCFGAANIPLPPMPHSGLSLLQCLNNLPALDDLLRMLGTPLRMVRATVTSESAAGDRSKRWTLVVHPQEQSVIDAFGACTRLHPAAINHLKITELPSGYIVHEPSGVQNSELSLPHGVSLSDQFTYFHCVRPALNEFGYFYAALHICGNFARYYPDVWLAHIDRSSDLSIAIDSLCATAMERLTLLTLSELMGQFHVTKN